MSEEKKPNGKVVDATIKDVMTDDSYRKYKGMKRQGRHKAQAVMPSQAELDQMQVEKQREKDRQLFELTIYHQSIKEQETYIEDVSETIKRLESDSPVRDDQGILLSVARLKQKKVKEIFALNKMYANFRFGLEDAKRDHDIDIDDINTFIQSMVK